MILFRKLAIFLSLLLISNLITKAQYIPQVDTATLALSPNGDYIAVATLELVNIIDMANQEIINTFNVSNYFSTEIEWSPNGNKIAFQNHLVTEIWNNPTSLPSFEISLDGTNGIAWHPNGEMIAVGNLESVYIWNTLDYSLVAEQHFGSVQSLTWNNAGNLLFVGGSSFVQTYTIETGISEQIIRLEPFLSPEQYYINPSTFDIAISPSQEQIAIASDYRVYVVNIEEPTSDMISQDTKSIFDYFFNVYSVAWHPSGLYLATSGQDATIRVWDVAAKEEIYRIEYPEYVSLRDVTWSPDGQELIYSSPDGQASLVFVDSASFLPTEP